MPRRCCASYIGRIAMQNAATGQINPAKRMTIAAEAQ